MGLERLLNSDALFDGRYRIVDILGKGGMSTVYLAENSKLGTLWAIKENCKNAGQQPDIRSEVEVLKKLNHPALPRIYDVIEDEQYIYVVEDYIPGTPLDRELAAAGRFAAGLVIEWGIQLCEVLSYLHSVKPNPVIYRDVKPSNIILAQGNRVKLVDFGSAREYRDLGHCDTVCLGTVGYAAPEQYGGGQSYITTDIYCLGVTLQQLATGRNPSAQPSHPPRTAGPQGELPPGLQAVISRCTQLQPSDRYQSMKELRAELLALSENKQPGLPLTRISAGQQALSYKRLIIAIWDNDEFSCELSYAAARLAGLKVNLVVPEAHEEAFYNRLGLNGRACRSNVLLNAEEQVLNPCTNPKCEAARSSSLRVTDCLDLTCLSSSAVSDKAALEDTGHLLDCWYQRYDMTILASGRYIDSGFVPAFQKADYILIPARADLDTLLEWSGEIRRIKLLFNISLSKIKYIAFEYKKGINLPLSFVRNFFFSNCSIGSISYTRERELCRNSGTVFPRILAEKSPEEYIYLLSFFNVFPRPGFWTKTGEWFRRCFGLKPVKGT